jgi:hypothetical protein
VTAVAVKGSRHGGDDRVSVVAAMTGSQWR